MGAQLERIRQSVKRFIPNNPEIPYTAHVPGGEPFLPDTPTTPDRQSTVFSRDRKVSRRSIILGTGGATIAAIAGCADEPVPPPRSEQSPTITQRQTPEPTTSAPTTTPDTVQPTETKHSETTGLEREINSLATDIAGFTYSRYNSDQAYNLGSKDTNGVFAGYQVTINTGVETLANNKKEYRLFVVEATVEEPPDERPNFNNVTDVTVGAYTGQIPSDPQPIEEYMLTRTNEKGWQLTRFSTVLINGNERHEITHRYTKPGPNDPPLDNDAYRRDLKRMKELQQCAESAQFGNPFAIETNRGSTPPGLRAQCASS